MQTAIKIKRKTLESIAEAARNVFPKEFIALLGKNKKTGIIEELVILPATFGEDFSSIDLHLVPFDESIVGSIHSHPSPNNNPSRGDKAFFKKTGEIHLIISYPFNLENTKAVNSDGKTIEIQVVE